MSLSEQLQRVDGGQIAALKALIQKYGGTVPEGTKIDGYANIINGLGIYSQQEILSDETRTALGLPNTAVPDDALESIAGFMSGGSYLKRTLLNEYTYDGSATVQFSFNGLDLYKLYALVISTPSGQENRGEVRMGGSGVSGINIVNGNTQGSSAVLGSASPLIVFIAFSTFGSAQADANTFCVCNYNKGIPFVQMRINRQGNLGTSGYIQGTGIVGTNYKLYQLG